MYHLRSISCLGPILPSGLFLEMGLDSLLRLTCSHSANKEIVIKFGFCQSLLYQNVQLMGITTVCHHIASLSLTRFTFGGPIGLCSTCALARVVMGRWDQKWKEQLTIRPGWRWMRGSLWWRADWEREDRCCLMWRSPKGLSLGVCRD